MAALTLVTLVLRGCSALRGGASVNLRRGTSGAAYPTPEIDTSMRHPTQDPVQVIKPEPWQEKPEVGDDLGFDAGVGHAHGVPAGLLQHRQAAVDGPLGGRVGGAEEEAEDLLGGVVAQPHHRQQQPVGVGQGVGAAGAVGAAAAGAVAAAALGVVQGRQHVGGQVVEEVDGQAGEVAEDRRVSPQVLQPRQHRRLERKDKGVALFLGKGPIATKVY